ncbi:MAG: DUF6335 family protein [Acidobacteriota bacterium]|nr:DUF6335 family protein [Acidobacteriota bacterium]
MLDCNLLSRFPMCYAFLTMENNKEDDMTGKDLEFYEKETPPDAEIKEFMDDEIAHAPQAPNELKERLREHHSSSPADSGGDIDASWEEVNSTGAESVFGHNPTPDQSDVEENAHAMGIDYQDNQPLDLLEKMEKRDRDRFELDESSKGEGDMI